MESAIKHLSPVDNSVIGIERLTFSPHTLYKYYDTIHSTRPPQDEMQATGKRLIQYVGNVALADIQNATHREAVSTFCAKIEQEVGLSVLVSKNARLIL